MLKYIFLLPSILWLTHSNRSLSPSTVVAYCGQQKCYTATHTHSFTYTHEREKERQTNQKSERKQKEVDFI